MRNPQILEVLSALGVQMDEMAQRLCWSYDLLSEYATTSKEVPEEVINSLAKELSVSPDVFFNDRYETLTK